MTDRPGDLAPTRVSELTQEEFSSIADRWLPLIYRGAIEYQVPGKFDSDDLVQEGLQLLFQEITKRVLTLQRWEVDSGDFEKYFKSALFHRFVDMKRSVVTKKRDHKKEVYSTDDYDPIANIISSCFDDCETSIEGDDFYEKLALRLNETCQSVLECIVNPPERMLRSLREHICYNCLYLGDPTPDGKCPACIGNGFENVGNLVPKKLSPSRILQSEIQQYLGLSRMVVSESIQIIRATIRTLSSTPDRINLTSFMSLFGYEVRAWPTINGRRLSYNDLGTLLAGVELKLLNFMMDHSTEYYAQMKYTDMSRRMKLSVHELRGAVDSIRIKLEFLDSGVPIRNIPKVF